MYTCGFSLIKIKYISMHMYAFIDIYTNIKSVERCAFGRDSINVYWTYLNLYNISFLPDTN